MKKNVLFLVSSADNIGSKNRKTGNFLAEVSHPFHEFIQKGYVVDFASVNGGEPPIDGLDLEDPINKTFIEGEGWEKMKASKKITATVANDYDAVFIPGGLGPMVDMADNPVVQNVIANVYDSGRVVGAVCHGPVSLLNVKLSNDSFLIDGKNITSFSNAEEKAYAHEDVPFLLETALVEKGARFTSVAEWQPYSIADGKLVTGQNPASAAGVAQKMIAILES